jgi:flagellar biosynthesis/type III secretory pathway protein FliH
VRKRASLEGAEPTTLPKPTAARAAGRVVQARVIEAEAEARRILDAADARARALVGAAERAASEVRLRAESEGRADGIASVAARAVALAHTEARAEERQLERTIELARVLAERLLGEALALSPERVTALARQALKEARGARQVKIVAHPADAAILEQSLDELGVEPACVSIGRDENRERGSLQMVTDIGILDAELAPQLARLAIKLREALR